MLTQRAFDACAAYLRGNTSRYGGADTCYDLAVAGMLRPALRAGVPVAAQQPQAEIRVGNSLAFVA